MKVLSRALMKIELLNYKIVFSEGHTEWTGAVLVDCLILRRSKRLNISQKVSRAVSVMMMIK